MILRRGCALAAAAALTIAPAACESTADRAHRLFPNAGKGFDSKALRITENSQIRTKVIALLNGADGTSAVVVSLRSLDPKRSIVWAPISVTLKDGRGKVVGTTNIDGADPLLVHLPSLAANGVSYYVNDQLSPDAKPASAVVKLGGTMLALKTPPARLRVAAKMLNDPNFGWSFKGVVTNTTNVVQQQVIVQAIATDGQRIAAAGTAIVRGLKPGEKRAFNGLFVGDPKGAQLTVIAPASNADGAKGAPKSSDTTG